MGEWQNTGFMLLCYKEKKSGFEFLFLLPVWSGTTVLMSSRILWLFFKRRKLEWEVNELNKCHESSQPKFVDEKYSWCACRVCACLAYFICLKMLITDENNSPSGCGVYEDMDADCLKERGQEEL